MNASTRRDDTLVARLLYIGQEDEGKAVVELLRRDGIAASWRVAFDRRSVEDALQTSSWSFVVADEDLDGWSGLDALRMVRERYPHLPFVMLGAGSDDDRAAQVISAGANDYLSKDHRDRMGAVLRREMRDAATRSERSHLFAELRRNKERYRRTFEKAPIGIANLSGDGRFTAVNEHFNSMLGYTRREIIGRTFASCIHPDDVSDCERWIAQCAERHGAKLYRDARFVHKDGATVWMHVTVTLVANEQGQQDVIALFQDITEQRAITRRVSLQARLLDSVEQAVTATDLENRIIYWNRHAENLYGWSASEAEGRSIVEMTAPEFVRPLAEESFARVYRGESYIGEMVMQRRDGATFPAWVVIGPIHDDDGSVVGTVAVSHDLSAMKAAEQDLRAHKEQLAEAQRIANIGSWQYVPATGSQTWSDEMSRMFGLSPGTGLTLGELRAMIAPADRERVTALARMALTKGMQTETDCRIVLPGGEVRTLHVSGRVMTDTHGVAQKVIAVAQDVTSSRHADESMRRYATQQTAIANLSHLALSGASLEELFDETTSFIREVLESDLCEVSRDDGDGLVMVAGNGWEPGLVGRTRPAGPLSLAAFTLRERGAVISNDVTADERFKPSDLLIRHGVRGAATVPIGAGGEAWGFLGAYSQTPRTLSHGEIEFLGTVATILGQSTQRVRADTELRVRAEQESAIAELGALVFSGVDQKTLERACELARKGLRVDHALLHERTNGTLRVRAGHVWHPNFRVITTVGSESQSGKTAVTRQPVVVQDYFRDERFSKEVRDAAAATSVRSGISVPVLGSKTFFGVLSAYNSAPRAYTDADVHFMQSLANVVSEAMERERATQALVASEERYRSVVEGASEIIFDVDRYGRICAINRAFETFTGHSRDNFIGRPFHELFDGADQGLSNDLFHALTSSRKTLTWEAAVLRADGTRMLLDVTSVPKVVNGEVVSMYGFARDITESRRTEQERQQLTSNLQLLLESTAEGIVAVDVEGRCELVNRSAARMLGCAVEDMAGKNMHALCHSRYADGSPRPASDCPIQDVLHNGATLVVADDTFWRADGTPFPVEYSAAPLIDEGRTVGIVVTFSDITARRALEAKLEQANRLSSLGRLAATIAHEFNNVLMGIAPFVDVIRRTTDRERIESALGHVTLSVARGKRITNEILRFTQPSEPSLARIDVSEWLRAVTTEAHSLLPPTCTLDVVAEEGLAIEGDVNQLHQMLTNLILNARDAMPSGGVLSLHAKRESPGTRFAFGNVDRPERYVHLSVRDTGSGMSAETRRHIFELLFTTKKSGTGLGLPLAHQIVMRHGGEIFVESALGAGTTFHIFLPASAGPAPIAEPAAETANNASLQARRVLVVEDDETVAVAIKSLLESEGMTVAVVGSGAEAIEAAAADVPDVVVLDVGLPDMEGPAVYEAIAATNPGIPVIFSTGHADASRLDDYLSKPTVSYLLKPYDAAALIASIGEVSRGATSPASPRRR